MTHKEKDEYIKELKTEIIDLKTSINEANSEKLRFQKLLKTEKLIKDTLKSQAEDQRKSINRYQDIEGRLVYTHNKVIRKNDKLKKEVMKPCQNEFIRGYWAALNKFEKQISFIQYGE